MCALATAIVGEALPSLEILALGFNEAGDGCGAREEPEVGLADAIRLGALPKLRLLDLRHNAIGLSETQALSSAWQEALVDCRLQRLLLGGNALRDEGCGMVAEALSSRVCSRPLCSSTCQPT